MEKMNVQSFAQLVSIAEWLGVLVQVSGLENKTRPLAVGTMIFEAIERGSIIAYLYRSREPRSASGIGQGTAHLYPLGNWSARECDRCEGGRTHVSCCFLFFGDQRLLIGLS